MDRQGTTVTNVVEGCVYIRKRFYAISLIRGELQHSALRSLLLLSSLSSNTTKIRTLIRPRGGQGIQAWTLRTRSVLGKEASGLVRGRNRAAFSWRQEGLGVFYSPCVHDSVSFLSEKSIHVTIHFVSNRRCIPPWLGYDPFHLCHSVIQYG